MYRPLTPKQRDRLARKVQAMRRGRDATRMARPAHGSAPQLPDLRRVISVTDHDSGEPVTHTMYLYRTARVDTYRIEIDGAFWKCAGWSAALVALRKAYPRVPSARSDFWLASA